LRTITWNRDLAVGIEDIDSDNRQLIQQLNDLLAACFVGQGPAILGQTLCMMQRYTRDHFFREERFMRKSGFPGYASHQDLHAKLIVDLDDLIEAFEFNPDHDLSIKTMQFLEDWLVQHIFIEDKKIGRHVGAID